MMKTDFVIMCSHGNCNHGSYAWCVFGQLFCISASILITMFTYLLGSYICCRDNISSNHDDYTVLYFLFGYFRLMVLVH